MAHYTLIARINTGDGKFSFVNVQFSKNHRLIPIKAATYYLRPGNRGRRTPIKIGTTLNAAIAAQLNKVLPGYTGGERRRARSRQDSSIVRCVADLHGLKLPGSTLSAANRNVSASARPRSRSGWTSIGRIKPSRFASSRRAPYESGHLQTLEVSFETTEPSLASTRSP